MRKIILALAILLPGCATVYRVSVNSYLVPGPQSQALPAGSSFCVLDNKDSDNALLDAEVKAKIESLLKEKGYALAPYEKADFLLVYAYRMSPGRTTTEMVTQRTPPETATVQTQKSDGTVETSVISLPSQTVYVPQQITVYTASLKLEVFDARIFRETGKRVMLWLGDNASTSENQDLRDMINYLLVASFERFAQNTGKSLQVNLSERDSRIKRLLSRPGV